MSSDSSKPRNEGRRMKADKPNLNIVRTEVNSLPSYGLSAGSELVKKSDVLKILDEHLPEHSSRWKAGS